MNEQCDSCELVACMSHPEPIEKLDRITTIEADKVLGRRSFTT